MSHHQGDKGEVLAFAIITVSDSRGRADDVSGDALAARVAAAHHRLVRRDLVRDEAPAIVAALEAALAAGARLVLVTGGTGLAARDVTPDALLPRFERAIPGFGELFRQLSYQDIGAKALLSRAEAGVVGEAVVFLLPGSTNACILAVEKLILPVAGHLVGLTERA